MSTKLKTVTHIPLMKLMTSFDTRYRINSDDYWQVLIDDHMFRGNDTTKKFYNAFANEIPDEAVLSAFNWPEAMRAVIEDPKGHPGEKEVFEAIKKTTLSEWATLFKEAVALKKREAYTDNATLDDYWYNYLIRGMFESMVVVEYQLENEEDLYYYISW